jgi:hypothetical protein
VWKWCGPLWRFSLEADHGSTVRREICISFRRARLRRQINARRNSVVALSPHACRRSRPFLAVRWLDGAPGKSVVVEVYPALWSHSFPRDGRDSHQQDAYAAAEWLRRSDQDGSLGRFFSPSLTEPERKVAEIEGWILGIA